MGWIESIIEHHDKKPIELGNIYNFNITNVLALGYQGGDRLKWRYENSKVTYWITADGKIDFKVEHISFPDEVIHTL